MRKTSSTVRARAREGAARLVERRSLAGIGVRAPSRRRARMKTRV